MFAFYKNIPVLTYHKITNQSEFGLTTLSLSTFEAQMEYLYNEGFRTIIPRNYENPLGKSLIVSFDDAYENIAKNAFPIMQKFNFIGLIFPITNFIGKENNWDANLGGIKFRHASLEQLSHLLEAGWEIASHSRNHTIHLLDQNLDDEIISSKNYLESKFNIAISSFSYPFGYVNKNILRTVKANYKYAFTSTMNNGDDSYNIPRVTIYSYEGVKQLKKKLTLNSLECLKLKMIHIGAKATILYQKLINI